MSCAQTFPLLEEEFGVRQIDIILACLFVYSIERGVEDLCR